MGATSFQVTAPTALSFLFLQLWSRVWIHISFGTDQGGATRILSHCVKRLTTDNMRSVLLASGPSLVSWQTASTFPVLQRISKVRLPCRRKARGRPARLAGVVLFEPLYTPVGSVFESAFAR